MDKKKTLSLQVSTGSYGQMSSAIIEKALHQRSNYVCIANAHMVVEARRSDEFAAIVNDAAIVTPDGMPVTWALNFLHGIKQERVCGMDLLPDLLYRAEQKELPVFFYGGTSSLLDASRKYLDRHYPSLTVAGMYSPPFRDLDEDEKDEIGEMINRSGAKLVLVVLGCPKQEKWMASMKGRVNALMVGVGGALPVMIGLQKRAPVWMQQNGLEWLFRLKQEPGRLFWRYAATNSIFCLMLIKDILVRWSPLRNVIAKSAINEAFSGSP